MYIRMLVKGISSSMSNIYICMDVTMNEMNDFMVPNNPSTLTRPLQAQHWPFQDFSQPLLLLRKIRLMAIPTTNTTSIAVPTSCYHPTRKTYIADNFSHNASSQD